MPELDTITREHLASLLPVPEGAAPDWGDVLRRSRPARRRRMPLLAIAAAIAVCCAAVAVADVGGFSSWLTGEPGTAVSQADQQAFESAASRTWASFAPSTELRQLLTTTVSGTTFTLDGFRSGDDLCLKLTLAGAQTGDATRCAPEHDLQAATQPAVVVSADESFGDHGDAAAYQATFGLASDGVQRIVVNGDDGTHDATVGGNAFLYVDDHPARGARVRDVTAVAQNGDRVALAFESSPYGFFDMSAPPQGVLHGPSKVQRQVTGGTIGWLARGEKPGTDVPADLADKVSMLATSPPPAFGPHPWPTQPEQVVESRLIQPDPNDFTRIAVTGVSPSGSMTDPEAGVCFGIVGGRGISSSCARTREEFAHGPLYLTLGGSGGSQFELLSGLASDDVARIAAYLGDGEVVPVALQDNAFLARVANSKFPLRVVAYDSDGRVIEVQDFATDGLTSPAPKAAQTSVKEIAHLTGPNGGSGTLQAGDVVGGYRCWSIDFVGNGSEGGCTPWPMHDGGVTTLGLWHSKGDTFLAGEVQGSVASVRADWSNGTSTTYDTTRGFVFASAPAGADSVTLHGYDEHGKEVAQAGLHASPRP